MLSGKNHSQKNPQRLHEILLKSIEKVQKYLTQWVIYNNLYDPWLYEYSYVNYVGTGFVFFPNILKNKIIIFELQYNS